MNIFNTQQTQMKAKSSAATGGNVLDVLGNHKNLTPEQIKLLQKQGKLQKDSGAFETLLKDTQKNQNNLKNMKNNPKMMNPQMDNPLVQNKLNGNPQNLKQVLQNKTQSNQGHVLNNSAKNMGLQQMSQTGQQGIAAQGSGQSAQNISNQNPAIKQQLMNAQTAGKMNHNRDVLNQSTQLKQSPVNGNHQVTPQGETKVARVLKLGQSTNLKTTYNNPNQGVENVLNQKAAHQTAQNQLKTHNPVVQVGASTQVAQAHNKTMANGKAKNGLMNFNEFMKKQSPHARGRIAAKSEMYKSAKANKSMFAQKMNNSLPGVVKKQQTQVKLQDVMFNQQDPAGSNSNQNLNQAQMQQGMMGATTAAVAGAEQGAKVFDMNAMTKNMTSDEIITKIQDYAIQTRAGNESQVEVSFKHQDLGRIDLLVQKMQGDQLNISIGTNSIEGAHFFKQNQGELLQSLTQAGISVGDLKLDSGNKTSNQNLAGEFGRDQEQQQKKEHGSESGQRQEDQNRRNELWEQFRDKEAA